ncbi:MAG TPA: prepilin-type N-terminal cleavage/methylation domain-containing protein [Candidatus Saccharimonadia bacterium]|jgi:prepilin-type N-terminal cleavage/methylation domain-containing protein|nr:prepilin-type N-terminal cleavage/methylation domain-containing protein [Candidatus Saccharimonadia bacterium]
MLMKRANQRRKGNEQGFTLVELLVAMAVFSFMLVIVVVGFINIVHLHNQAIASNMAQDNARTAIDEIVRAVRDSQGEITATAGPNGTLCVGSPTAGQERYYYLNAGILYRASNCTTHLPTQAVTSNVVVVSNFAPVVQSVGPTVVKPVVQVAITVGSNNGTTTGSGAGLSCNNSNADRTFCSVVTLTSGAVPR